MVNYEPIWNKDRTEITGYAHVKVNPGRRVPPKPSLDGLDGLSDPDANGIAEEDNEG